MTFQPKTDPGSLPRSIPTATEKEYGEMSISELVDVLRIAYKIEDFDKIEEELVKREAKLRAEIGSLGEKFELERLKRIEVEERLKIREEQYKKGKRAQDNYEQLLKEVKTGRLVEKHAIEEFIKKNVALEGEVYELKEFRKKMLDEVKSMDELRDKIRVWKEEKVGDKNALDVFIMKNIELQEAVKKNLTVIEGLKNENGKLTDEKHELKTLFESLEKRYSKLRVSDVKLEESTMPLMSEDAFDCGNTEVEPNLGVSFAVKDEKDVSDNELENDTGEPVPLQRDEDTHYSVDTGTVQSPNKGNKEDAIGALGVKFKLEKDIMDLSDDDDKYTSQGFHGEKAIPQIIEENEHPQRVEIIKRKRASDIQASTSTSTSFADLFETENLPVKRNMARTQGASSYQGKSSCQGENRRLTASARRRQEEADIHKEKHNVIEEQHHVQEREDVNVGEKEVCGFPGGPHDTSLLTHYARHVAHALWQGEDRGVIKLISHGKKLNRFGACHEAIEEIVLNSGLLPLCGISYDYVDKGLLLAFAERWHLETNTFHLPVGEMSITLDDVSSLLHLSIEGEFCPVKDLEWEEAQSALMDLLGVDYERAGTEMT
ncbi:uncharacterized protein LOC124838618 [Vigna umbellata]|uniref:uncharacterized protein LOC124838618 n=2 Tax=Vigna umbellata TaxID=87088 RepID=UPI001F5E5555|nr:uncharacterized protein LOC124838618 [Vigna umbellata]